jgi:Flp pilus assembly protein TadB
MSESRFDARLAAAGLFAAVAAVWALLLAGGSLDGTWLLAGFLAVGMGMLAINLIDRAAAHFAPTEDTAEAGDHAEEPPADKPSRRRQAEVDAEEPDQAAGVGPRLRLLIGSSCLEALAVALIVSYYSGSLVVSLMVGVIAGALAIAVSLLLARRLTPA